MASEYLAVYRVRFSDTDTAGIMHFSNFLRYMEDTEHAFLRSLGFSVHARLGGKTYGWPRVHIEGDFRRPLRFEDEFEVRLQVREKREKSLTYAFSVRRIGAKAEDIAAQGLFTVVCVMLNAESGVMQAAAIPDALARQIEVAEEFEEEVFPPSPE